MSRINGSADRVFPALFFFGGLAIYLLVDFFWLRRPHKARSMPLTRGRIIYLAWGAEAVRMVALMIALCLLPTLAFLHGGIGLSGWIGTISTLLFFMLALLCSLLWYRWPAIQALHGKRRIPLPENAELENVDGTWFYQDEKWYIRINKGYALLYAPQIDFEVPVQYESRYAIKGGQLLFLRFAGLDGIPQYALHDLDDKIEKWVKVHKGCFFRKPAPKKPHK